MSLCWITSLCFRGVTVCDGVCVHYRLYEPDPEMDGLHKMIEGRTVVFFVPLLCRFNKLE